ncbi:MAG: hypothetical protein E7613_02635 [Ruminococcaceae bacterium]|nr:hypothetical protein [Oscillospiraceae bacterium]
MKRYLISFHVLVVLLLGLSVLAWLKPADEFSTSERRPFAQFPEVSVKSVLSGEFTAAFEEYATDQFPFRDDFRTLKAIAKFYVFNQKDNNDIYIYDSQASKLDTVMKDNMIENSLQKMNFLYNSFVKGKTDKVYFSVIPDKSHTLAPAGGYPSLDYEALANRFKDGLEWAEYIDIYPYLHYSDYYTTDTHWSQDKIVDVAQVIADKMGATVEKDLTSVTLDKDFYGVYYGQSSLPLPPDKITYLTSDIIEGCEVYNFEKGYDFTTGRYTTVDKVYDMEKLDSKDPYEMFLSGATPLLRIKNPACDTGRRLIIFRDSYTSSLAPLLLESYSEVILIDIRYMMSTFVGNFVTATEFKDADVLFLYSAMILNSSESFR